MLRAHAHDAPLGWEAKAGDCTPATTSGGQSPPDSRSPRGRGSSSLSGGTDRGWGLPPGDELLLQELHDDASDDDGELSFQAPVPRLGLRRASESSGASLRSEPEEETPLAARAAVHIVRRAAYEHAARQLRVEELRPGGWRGFLGWLFGYGEGDEPSSPSQAGRKASYDIDSLEELGHLGQGAFGTVFLVRCRATGQRFALKAMSKEMLALNNLQHSADNERRVLKMRSPFLIRFEATFDVGDHHCLLMEAALGGGLCAVYRRHRLYGSEAHARFYTACVLVALEYLHGRGWAYRDVKMENLVLDTRGYGKLCDFGTCKQLQGSRTFTVCGTPEYMAPEVTSGEGYSVAVDWWALGVLLFELLVGATPFPHEEGADNVFRRDIEEVEFPVDPSCSWSSLVRGLCRQDPDKRLPMCQGGAANVKSQAWFAEGGFDWTALERRSLPPAHAPEPR